MKAHDLEKALAGIAARAVTTAEEDAAAFPRLASFDRGALYVGRFAGETPWERHRGGDELLHVLDGAVEVTVLTDEGTRQTHVSAGCVFVVPRGLWHRQLALPSVTLFAVTPDDSEVSHADDPRTRS
jgi:quercetin dioxygenase-like cupin family protein